MSKYFLTKLDGAIVTFEVKKVCQEVNRVLGGYNLWGGEHLNFLSKKPMSVIEGQNFTVIVLYTITATEELGKIEVELKQALLEAGNR